MTYFNNRPLTAKEQQLHNQNKCICCGVPVTKGTIECYLCTRTRTQVHQDDWFGKQPITHNQLSKLYKYA